ncbi:MAG: VOC family protein [Pseudomonadales bacterium]|nr:VOC family protein [Pseudomonadales bacterium]
MTKHGEFNWIELQTQNTDAAIEFYKNAAGWRFQSETMPNGGKYWLAMLGEKVVCGIWTLEEGSSELARNRWVIYLHVDDIDSALAQAKSAGAEVLREPWDVPGVGRIAMIRDPGGAEIGWVTPTSAKAG